MRSLRSEFIGSMRAWLPSLRSTAHQRGACSMRFVGHVRSGSWKGICSWNGTYFWNGIPDVCWGWIIAALSSSAFRSVSGRTRETPRRGGPGSGLVAAEKEEAHRSHDFTVCRVLGILTRVGDLLLGARGHRLVLLEDLQLVVVCSSLRHVRLLLGSLGRWNASGALADHEGVPVGVGELDEVDAPDVLDVRRDR